MRSTPLGPPARTTISPNSSGTDEPAARGDRVGEGLARRCGFGADLARGVLRVLRADRVGDVGGRDAEARHLVGLQPDAHRIAGAEQRHVTDAGDALQLVDQVDCRVICQECRVAFSTRRLKADHEQDVVRALLHDDAVAADFVGQPRQRELHAVVQLEHRLVDVGADFERRRDRDGAVRRGARVEVNHVLDAGELFFDRRRHGLRERLGARAGIARADRHSGRRNLGILRHRERHCGYETRERNDDREHAREDRTFDEETRKVTHVRTRSARRVRRRRCFLVGCNRSR